MSDAPSGARFDPLIARLQDLHPRLIDLSLDRLRRLLERLGHPERRLPPVIHVAGTNGKGSTCAFLRAIGEAAGRRVHVYTSPHLVSFNERIRVAGRLVEEERLADVLDHVERVNDAAPITIFEIITAAAFVLFADTPADLCVLEVGLGGRGDATNVIPPPAAAAITAISMDHREFLGDTIAAVAAEKAGILKPGTVGITGLQSREAMAVLTAAATACNAPWFARDDAWTIEPAAAGLRYRDRWGDIELPRPSLLGNHQYDNAGIAIAALRHANLGEGASRTAGLAPDPALISEGIAQARWPARLQRLHGRLATALPPEWELWLDGGHNPGAAVVLAETLAGWRDRPTDLVVGMKQTKEAAAFLAPLLPHARSILAVAEPGQHAAMPAAALVAASGGVAREAGTVAAALAMLSHERGPARVLVCGSLYLAGVVLRADGTVSEGDGTA